MTRVPVVCAFAAFALAAAARAAGPATQSVDYAKAAGEVMRKLEAAFSLPGTGLYAESLKERHPAFMWGNGVAFSALVAAARHDPVHYRARMDRFFHALDRYWDAKAPVPGYEPAPTRGNGHDKYYDDNAWMVLGFAEAYGLTHDPAYLARAKAASAFVLSGTDSTLGGGIWWHEAHKAGSKNTCVTAPAAVGCLALAQYAKGAAADQDVAAARTLTDWTTARLLAPDGLYADNVKADTGRVEPHQWTYNSGLMMRAYVGLYRRTGDAADLDHAKSIATAANAFVDPKTGAYHDGYRFTHLLVEADLDLYRTTGDPALLARAKANADHAYAKFQSGPPAEMIETAAIARMLWLTAEAVHGRAGPGDAPATRPAP